MLKLVNPNYCATVVKVEKLVQLENCNNVQAAIIMGNQIIVSKEVKVGDVGLFFPVEVQLSKKYLSENNLYRKKELNSDPEAKSGYFEENGRIRCVKFRGHKSEGLFMPLNSLDFLNLKKSLSIGDEFNEIDGVEIAKKYVIKTRQSGPSTIKNKSPKESKIIEGQFNFHIDTSQLYRNLDKINPNDLIQITYKIHGTSGISSYVLCKKKLNWFEKVLKKFRLNIIDKEYDYIYSSRKVVKNPEINKNAVHFYETDIWGLAHKELIPYLQKGMTIYYEIAGYLPTGAYIQNQYDYGCEPGKFKIFIYRITQTNEDGKVYEFSGKQVQDFCKKYGLDAVPELFYGYAKEFSDERMTLENWKEKFLENLKAKYNDKDCYICKNVVPEEGIVLRKETIDIESYKLKSNRFYEFETKLLDSGVTDIEEEN